MTKYYSDKKKLVLNGIIQLDNILLGYKGDTKDVKIPLFQALGFSADIYYLYRVNPFVYILNHVGSLNYPVSKKDTANKTTDLIGMLLKLKVEYDKGTRREYF
ncbi:hypothetical protein HPULCUR_004516 [Helicostylum pulchrum]|uniref:Uncharacterized protein n=1 Tax=Helicostylum pulchrum TaxID=562976 RepID=A0ABP9XWG2_9FUNG